MSSVEGKIPEVQKKKISKEEILKLKTEKIAVITLGRWQPPHAGHLELIDGTYDKVMDLRKSGFRNVDGFIWITPRPDEKPGSSSEPDFINKNPLFFIDKWLYLNYIIPFDEYGTNLKFLTLSDIDIEINEKVFRDDRDNASFLTASHNLREHGNIDELSECQKEKYSLLFYSGNQDFNKFKKRTTFINVNSRKPSPSATCIDFLKNRGYTQLLLLVGSDRVDAFEKYNRTHLDQAFGAGNGIIEQIGLNRGSAGKGLLFDLGTERGDERSDDSPLHSAAGIMDQCSIYGQGCDEERKGGEEKHGVSEAPPVSIAGRFSGTRIRNCAYNLENLDYYCEGTIIGDMTKELSFCLLNDLRKRHLPELPAITKSQWNENVSSPYHFFGAGLEYNELHSRLTLFNTMYGATTGGKKTRKKRKKNKKTRRKKKKKKKKKNKKSKKKHRKSKRKNRKQKN
jgi:hypothetical protein